MRDCEQGLSRRTALHCAAYGGYTDCLNVLLSEGQASINLQDSEGITALHWACSAGHMEAIQLLISAGANVNMMELDGERLTALDYAIIGGHQEVAQLLIENGALSISSIRELAAIMIQKCARGFVARRKVVPLLQRARDEKARDSTDGAAAAPSGGSAGSGGRSLVTSPLKDEPKSAVSRVTWATKEESYAKTTRCVRACVKESCWEKLKGTSFDALITLFL